MRRPFYAKYDPNATWMDHLKPAFGKEKFFFEEEGGSRSEYGIETPGHRKVIPLISARQEAAAAAVSAGCSAPNAA